MKRFVILLCIALLFVGVSISAEESVLIDFALLAADTDNGQNEATILDFADKAGSSFTDEEKALMKTSLALNNWEVVLASSSRTVVNQSNSLTREVLVKDSAKKYAGERVLGVRIHFPNEPFNSWAIIRPPFEIPAYMPKDDQDRLGAKFEGGYGVVKNVGVIKSVSIEVYGSNFPNGLGIILKNENNEETNIFMDYLEFDGWKTLTWNNPNYISEVRNRELTRYPLYPRVAPLVKLAGIIIYKDAAQEGGDFVTYIRRITIVYDKAVLDLERDIDDEAIWGILTAREEARRTAEFNRLGNLQVLRYLEQKKMHSDNPDRN
jgi:hypothetical protein